MSPAGCGSRAYDLHDLERTAGVGCVLHIQQHYIGVPRQGGGVPEQYDRLVGGSRLIHSTL